MQDIGGMTIKENTRSLTVSYGRENVNVKQYISIGWDTCPVETNKMQ